MPRIHPAITQLCCRLHAELASGVLPPLAELPTFLIAYLYDAITIQDAVVLALQAAGLAPVAKIALVCPFDLAPGKRLVIAMPPDEEGLLVGVSLSGRVAFFAG